MLKPRNGAKWTAYLTRYGWPAAGTHGVADDALAGLQDCLNEIKADSGTGEYQTEVIHPIILDINGPRLNARGFLENPERSCSGRSQGLSVPIMRG